MKSGREIINIIEDRYGSYKEISLSKYVEFRKEGLVKEHVSFYEDEKFAEFYSFLNNIFGEKIAKSEAVHILNNAYYSEYEVIDIKKIFESLGEYKKFFKSEKDLKLSLIYEIKKIYPNVSATPEYSKYKLGRKNIDVVIEIGGKIIPIELRYKTDCCTIDDNGQIKNLKRHGAYLQGRYDFIKDIKNIEKCKKNIPNFLIGYAIMITNDKNYYQEVKNLKDTNDRDFRIDEGKFLQGTLNWKQDTSPGTMKNRTKPLILSSKYTIRWKNYSYIDNEEFKIAIIKID